MVAAISSDNINKTLTTRPPLEKDQQNNGNVQSRKPRGKQVPSRYMSPSPSSSSSTTTTTTNTSTSSNSVSSASVSKRFGSPLVSRSANSVSATKRSQSVDRKRPVGLSRPFTANPEAKQAGSEMSAASRMLITSTRSLSVSFQGETFSLPISKAKAVSSSSSSPNVARKATPERRRSTPVRDQGDNSRGLDQHRWPGRSRDGNSGLNERNHLLSRSFDYNGSVGSGLMTVRSLQQSLINDERRLSLDLGNAKQNPDSSLVNESSGTGDLSASDSDSVSSGSTSGRHDFGNGISRGNSGARGIIVSARFWQETNSRLRRLQDPGSPLSTSPNPRMSVSSKTVQSKRFSSDSPTASPRTVSSSPIRGATRPASPSKLWTPPASSPSRGISSPSRVRHMNGNSGSTPSILSFSVDLRRGKIGEERIVDAHMLRLLYNRYLQWRFANARADATFFVQKLNAEKNLWNAWVTISELRHSVTLRRVKLLLLRQKLKLTSILKGQITCLEEWSLLDRDHFNSLEGAMEALKASTLRLPIVGKTIADVQNLKDAVGSAVDVMHVMASSICLLSSKVEEINSLVAELMNVTAKEKFLLEQCKDFLSALAAMQVKDCSLRTHLIQLNRLPAS
ncbi:QWRF motif-containing protein 2 [Mercurialis annua]|uniref:QWRF motif-containing protein 2 n=1 Tax=Mercurialis annua TaxID=3986 RepID=UPI00215E22AE|nr:QWRF motif-containing protein 2 [Mercurialis annua]XP_050212245.1 QWRF motif-containing protein 2 [Mercurialis annua]